MLPFIDTRPTPLESSDSISREELERLRELPPEHARAIEDPEDVARLLAEARSVASVRASSPALEARAMGAAIARRVHILERTDDELDLAIRMLYRARLRLGPSERMRAARFGPILAIATHPRGTTDENALQQAATWLGSLDCADAARAIEALRRERAVLDADELRCRAYHSLRALLEHARS